MRRGLGQQRATGAAGSSRREAVRDAASRLLSPLEQGLESPLPNGGGDYLKIPLDEIRPDPANPRWALREPPSWEEIQEHSRVTDPEKLGEIEAIHGLKHSIVQIGQRQPIEVWKNGGWYQIVEGERRYWALRLAGHTHAEVKLLPEVPARAKLVQFITNFQRRDLPPAQQLANLEQVLEEAAKLSEPVTTPQSLIKLIGFTERTGYRWWTVLGGPEDVRVAVRQGLITSVRDAAAIAQEPDVEKRAEMIRDPAQRIGMQKADQTPSVSPKRSARGRRSEHVTFGRTKSTSVAKWIIEKLDPGADTSSVDWNDYREVNRLWKGLMERLERQVLGK